MQSDNRKMMLVLFAGVVMAGVWAAAGYTLGRSISLDLAKSRLKTHATGILLRGELSSGESRSVLAKLNQSPSPVCSDAELAYFRELLFHSEYLKDLGRVRDGTIACTAYYGRLANPIKLPKVKFEQADRTKVYLDLPEFKLADERSVSLQLDRSIVVFSPFILPRMEEVAMRYTITALDLGSGKIGQVIGEFSNLNPRILSHEGDYQVDGVLYSTRCSKRFFNCVTAYLPVAEVLKSDQAILPGYTTLSGVAGGLFGAASLLIYSRQKSVRSQLRRAIRKGELRVLYQPMVDISSRMIIGAEALVRWTDSDGLAIAPLTFVKVAEEFGFVGKITEFVVRLSLIELRPLLLQGNTPFRLNINVSAFDLTDQRFLPMLEATLVASGIRAERIGVELTESSTANREVAMLVIRELRGRGHYVCIDDFGTGYSSLSYLQDLAVDAIKVDRSFTKAIGTDAVTLSILPQILAISKSLKLDVVVEGIETERQAEFFASARQKVAGQGWLFGRPLAADDFMRALAENSAKLRAAGASKF